MYLSSEISGGRRVFLQVACYVDKATLHRHTRIIGNLHSERHIMSKLLNIEMGCTCEPTGDQYCHTDGCIGGYCWLASELEAMGADTRRTIMAAWHKVASGQSLTTYDLGALLACYAMLPGDAAHCSCGMYDGEHPMTAHLAAVAYQHKA
jgi:hypothetical protein